MRVSQKNELGLVRTGATYDLVHFHGHFLSYFSTTVSFTAKTKHSWESAERRKGWFWFWGFEVLVHVQLPEVRHNIMVAKACGKKGCSTRGSHKENSKRTSAPSLPTRSHFPTSPNTHRLQLMNVVVHWRSLEPAFTTQSLLKAHIWTLLRWRPNLQHTSFLKDTLDSNHNSGFLPEYCPLYVCTLYSPELWANLFIIVSKLSASITLLLQHLTDSQGAYRNQIQIYSLRSRITTEKGRIMLKYQGNLLTQRKQWKTNTYQKVCSSQAWTQYLMGPSVLKLANIYWGSTACTIKEFMILGERGLNWLRKHAWTPINHEEPCQWHVSTGHHESHQTSARRKYQNDTERHLWKSLCQNIIIYIYYI